MVGEGGAGEEEESHRSAGRLWPFGEVTLGAQQIGAQREAMADEEGAGEKDSNRTAGRLWPFAKADAVAAGQRTEEPKVVEDSIDGRPKSVISMRRIQRGAFTVITTQRTQSRY